MSMKRTPTDSHTVRAAALNASISRPMRMRPRPSRAANAVTPQSGIDTTNTRDADPGFSDLGGRFVLLYADAAELGR